MSQLSHIFRTIKEIYSKPLYIAVTLIALILYYFAFQYMISIQEQGVFLVTIPMYLVYALVVTSALAMTIGIYSIGNSRNNEAKEISTGIGAVTAFFGGLVGGCGCAEPIVLGITFLGVSTSDAFALLDFISTYQFALFSLMIVINAFVVMYYLNKLSQPACEIRKRR